MKRQKHIPLLIVTMVLMLAAHAQKKFIYTEGKNLMLPDGKTFIMRGTNLGNWLVPEGYMFKLKDVNSPRLINQALQN